MRMPLELRYADGFHLRAPRCLPDQSRIGASWRKRLSFAEATSTVRFMASLRLRNFRIEPDRTVAKLLDQQGQAGAPRSHLWEPLCVSALNTPVAFASAQVFANVLRDGLTGSRDRAISSSRAPISAKSSLSRLQNT